MCTWITGVLVLHWSWAGLHRSAEAWSSRLLRHRLGSWPRKPRGGHTHLTAGNRGCQHPVHTGHSGCCCGHGRQLTVAPVRQKARGLGRPREESHTGTELPDLDQDLLPEATILSQYRWSGGFNSTGKEYWFLLDIKDSATSRIPDRRASCSSLLDLPHCLLPK